MVDSRISISMLGWSLEKLANQRGQAVVQAEIDAAHPEGALAVAAVLFHGVEHPFITDHHLFGVSDEVTACRGQLHAAVVRSKMEIPSVLLQPADAFGQGGLRAVELKGCLQKCAVFYHRQHVADLVQLQQSTPSQNDPFHLLALTPARYNENGPNVLGAEWKIPGEREGKMHKKGIKDSIYSQEE